MQVISEQREDRQMLLVMHLSQLLNLITGFGGLIAPLILWQVKKDEIINMDEQGKQVVNFQLSMLIYAVISAVLCLILIGFFLLGILALLNIILPVINAINANNGKPTNYPLSIQFIK